MRTVLALTVALLLAPATQAEDKDALHQVGVDRFGGTYRIEPVSNFNACAAICAYEAACQAWTYKSPLSVTQGTGTCELKSSLGVAEANPTATSGISPELLARWPVAETERQVAAREAEEAELAGSEAPTKVAQSIPLFKLLGQAPIVTADPVLKPLPRRAAVETEVRRDKPLQVIGHDTLTISYSSATP